MKNSAAIRDMQQAIMSYIKANIPQNINKAHFGRVHGGKVIIGNKSYNYVPAVDLYFKDGDEVACVLPDSGNVAAIVGVL